MKKLIACIALCAMLTVAAATPVVGSKLVGSGLQRAYQLFIPIACSNAQYPAPTDLSHAALLGTGFPVGKELVMTAGHVSCEAAMSEDALTWISLDRGKTWRQVLSNQQFVHTTYDLRILYVPGAKLHDVAQIRDPQLGEPVTGYGIAAGVIATFGRVMHIEPTIVGSSNIVAGGMSGSALVADNGDVVGMTIAAHALGVDDNVVSAWVTSALPGRILKDAVASLKKYLPTFLKLQQELSDKSTQPSQP